MVSTAAAPGATRCHPGAQGTGLPWVTQGWLSPLPRVSSPGPGPCKVASRFARISDVEAFAKAMQNSATSEQKEGEGKDKKDEEEDMSLD